MGVYYYFSNAGEENKQVIPCVGLSFVAKFDSMSNQLQILKEVMRLNNWTEEDTIYVTPDYPEYPYYTFHQNKLHGYFPTGEYTLDEDGPQYQYEAVEIK